MKKIIFKLLLVGIVLGLNGCGNDVKEKKSDLKILMNEKENKLPNSTLKPADKNLEEKLLQNLPNLKTFTKLTKTLNKKSNSMILQTVKWENNKTYITIKVLGSGHLWLRRKERCQQGLFFKYCDGYDDYRFRIYDKVNHKEYVLSDITSSHIILSKRDSYRIPVNAGEKYTLIFNNTPQKSLRYFDLYENYCNANRYRSVCENRITFFNEELEEQNNILSILSKFNLNDISIKDLNKIYKKYDKYPEIQKIIVKAILNRTLQKNSIEELHKFNKEFSSHNKEVEKSIDKIYKLIKIKDSVAGYEWFIKNYKNSKYAKNAIERIHEIMFDKAKKLDTISAYNTFIFSYPTAKQVSEANRLANEKEKIIYTDLGLFSFWDTDHKKEKKARQLLIKAKQIERFPRDNKLKGNRAAGYFIVANRMYKLLQDEFNDSDATLRYLESQEFKDFVKEFRNIMEDIKYTLNEINQNTSDTGYYIKKLTEVSQKAFEDAKADRAMSAYYSKKHEEWEKQMHLRDKGYN